MAISLFLSDINSYLNTQVTSQPENKRIYRLVSRGAGPNGEAEKLTGKDLTAENNIYKFSTHSLFTVSNGTPKANYKTIQAAIDAAAATGLRETVLIAPGTYPEDFVCRDNVNIEAYSPPFEVDAHTTILTGNITFDLSDGGEISITRLTYLPTGGAALVIDGTAAFKLIANGCTFRSSTNDPVLQIDNPNLLTIFNNCMISGNDIAIDVSCQLIACRACILGDLIPTGTPRFITSASVNSIIYSNGNVKFEAAAPAQLIIANSFFNGSAELAQLAGATAIMFNSAYFGAGGDIFTGTGTLICSNNSFLGSTSIAAGVNVVPLADILTSGDYVPTFVINGGAANINLLRATWSRSGTVINVDFRFTYDAFIAANPNINMSLPLPPATFGTADAATGTGTIYNSISDSYIHAVISAVASSSNVNITAITAGAEEPATITGRFSYTMATF